MGCCASSSATSDQKDEPVSDKNTSPSPSLVDEKTVVTEVLSETTFVVNNESTMETTTKTKIPQAEEKKKPDLTDPGSVEPEVSLSESLLSIVTGEDEEEVKQRKTPRQRSPAKSRNRVMVNNYPTRLTEMSPRRRTNIEGAGLVRSERRSRSPAMNRSGMVRYSTENGVPMRKQSQSPGRVRRDSVRNGSEQECSQHQWPSYGVGGENYDSAPKDSFENPLVSLECFIFL